MTVAVLRLLAICPTMGKVRVANLLACAGLHLGATSAERMRPSASRPPHGTRRSRPRSARKWRTRIVNANAYGSGSIPSQVSWSRVLPRHALLCRPAHRAPRHPRTKLTPSAFQLPAPRAPGLSGSTVFRSIPACTSEPRDARSCCLCQCNKCFQPCYARGLVEQQRQQPARGRPRLRHADGPRQRPRLSLREDPVIARHDSCRFAKTLTPTLDP
jgi:hypothetical protein